MPRHTANRPRVVQLNLTDDEMEEFRRGALADDLPIATFVRRKALEATRTYLSRLQEVERTIYRPTERTSGHSN